MQVRIEDVSPVEKKLIVEVPWTTVSNKLSDAYRELSKSVRIKGFRQGKVPRSVLQRMYGKHVKAEVALQLIRESFVTANTEHDLDAVAEPKVDAPPDIKTGEPFSFEAIVEVKGHVEPKDYNGMELTRRPLRVTDEELDEALENLRREHTELLPIEDREVTAATDVVTLSLQGTVGEHTVDRPQLHVDLSETEREPLPGLVQALTGLPLRTENHLVELQIPDDYPDSSVAGQAAQLTISILDARRKEIPALDDELARDLERGETVEELRQSVRADLEKRKQSEIERELRETTLKELVKRNQIPVASALVEHGIEFRFSQFQSMMGMAADRSALSNIPEELREKMRPAALEEIRGQLLLEALAEKENIEVTDQDLDEHLAKLAEMRNQPVARLRAEYQRDGRLENLKYQLRHEKILDMLIERGSVTEAEPPAEEPEAAEAQAENAPEESP